MMEDASIGYLFSIWSWQIKDFWAWAGIFVEWNSLYLPLKVMMKVKWEMLSVQATQWQESLEGLIQ